jgi:GNAT superfamily N-acetyltransferase
MFRSATAGDVLALTQLERTANLAALGHVFPPDRHPFPLDDVLARWQIVLDDPRATVLVMDGAASEGSQGLDALVAYDDATLRHLAVHPRRWGQGLGGTAVGLAVAGLAARGCSRPELWALVENHRARALYERLGWRESGDRRPAVWPPHPVESRWVLPLPPHPSRRGRES